MEMTETSWANINANSIKLNFGTAQDVVLAVARIIPHGGVFLDSRCKDVNQ